MNKYLVRDLLKLGMWDNAMKTRILACNGSIQTIMEIPEPIKELYKTVWEIKQRTVIDQSADRGPYVCHTQSLNLYIEDPDYKKIMNMHFYAWKKQLKTGLYYLRTRPKAKTMSFTLEPTVAKSMVLPPTSLSAFDKTNDGDAGAGADADAQACRRDNPEGCLLCSS
jgi:ribonucleoside-diphosphate reductase alpha chain